MSNSLDPDQDKHSVGPDLGSNCLQRLLAEDKLQLTGKDLNENYPSRNVNLQEYKILSKSLLSDVNKMLFQLFLMFLG